MTSEAAAGSGPPGAGVIVSAADSLTGLLTDSTEVIGVV